MKTFSKKKQRIFSLAIFFAALVIFLWPAAGLWPALTYSGSDDTNLDQSELDDFIVNIETFRSPERTKRYSSEHFDFYVPHNYMTEQEVQDYMQWTEERRDVAISFLNYSNLDEIDAKIGVYIVDQPGISFSVGEYFVTYEIQSGLDHTVHEMVHSLDWLQIVLAMADNGIALPDDWAKMLGVFVDPESDKTLHPDAMNSFFAEQTTVSTEARFGSGLAFPNYGMPLNSILYARQRSHGKLEPLEKLAERTDLMEDGEYDMSVLRYVIAGSFGDYLFDTYGTEAHKQVLTDGYQGAYGKPLAELEQEWLAWLRSGARLQVLILSLGGLLVLGVGHLWLKRFWLWLAPTLMSMLAFLGWGYYLSYSDDELWGLIGAVALGVLLKFWKTKIGIAALWAAGLLAVLAGIVVPGF